MSNENPRKPENEEPTNEQITDQAPAKVEERVDELDRRDRLGQTFGQDADEEMTRFAREQREKQTPVAADFGDVTVADSGQLAQQFKQMLSDKLNVARQRQQPGRTGIVAGGGADFADRPSNPNENQPAMPFRPANPTDANPGAQQLQQFAPDDPAAWRHLGPMWQPPVPGLSDFQRKQARAEALWETEVNSRWNPMASQSYKLGQEVLGAGGLGAGLKPFPEQLDPDHDIVNFLARQYLKAKDNGREDIVSDVLTRLEHEKEAGKIPFAGEALQRLCYLDAVVDLKNARNDEDRMKALLKIAKLEERFGGREFELDKLPERLTGKQPEDLSAMIQEARLRVRRDALDEAVRSGDLAGQQDALRRLADIERKDAGAKDALDKFAQQSPDQAMQVKYARIASTEGNDGVYRNAGAAADGVLDGDRDTRRRHMRELEIARGTMRGAHGGFDKTMQWMKALESASELLHSLNKPDDAQQHVDALLKQRREGNERASEVLTALKIDSGEDAQRFMRALRDPEKKYETIADAARELRKFEHQYTDMRTYRHSTGKRPEDILREFPDQKLVAAARASAEKFAKDNYWQADNALGTFLDRNATPEQRQQAIAELAKAHADRTKHLGRSNFSGPLDWARTTDAALKMLDSGSKPQMTTAEAKAALEELQRMATDERNPSRQAQQYLLDLQKVGGADKLLRDLTEGKPESAKALQYTLGESVNKAMDSYRVIRITRELDEKTTPEKWEAARKALEAEVKAGNSVAGDWQKWAVSQEAIAHIGAAEKNPDRAREAIKQLAEAAKDNPYARLALATTLLANASPTQQRDWAELGGNASMNDKPMFVPQLHGLAERNPELLRTLQASAVTALDATTGSDKPNGGLKRSESIAMAFHFAANPKDERLQRFFQKHMNETVPGDFAGFTKPSPGSKAAMEGIHAALAIPVPGAESLADLYLKGVEHPSFTTKPFTGNATIGDTAALRVLSALAAGTGMNKRNHEEAATALLTAGSDSRVRNKVMDEMVRAYGVYNDNAALLSTLGKVAATNANIPDNVRETIHKGLCEVTANTRSSALEGLFAYAPNWSRADVEAVRKNLTAEMIAAIGKNAERIPEEFRDQLLRDSAKDLDSKDAKERVAALQTIAALAKYATEAQVVKVAQFGEAGGQGITDSRFKDAAGLAGLKNAGFSDTDANSIQKEASKTMLRLLGAQGPQASDAAFQAFGMLKWPGMENVDLRNAVLDYVRGKPISLEKMDQIHALVYDADIPPPTAQILRHWRPGLTDEDYYRRAQVIGENYGSESQSGDAFIRDMSNRVAIWNSLDPKQRQRLVPGSSDAPIDPATVEGLMYNKKLAETYPWMLDKQFYQKFDKLTTDARRESAEAEAEVQRLTQDRKDTLAALVKHTEKGAGWERLGSYSMYAMGLPGLALRSVVGDPLEEFERRQSEMTTAVANGDERIKEAWDRKTKADPVRDALQFAEAVRSYENSVNWGLRRTADAKALGMLDQYGVDVMRAYAPKAFADLTQRNGPGQFGRSGLERMCDNKIVADSNFQNYDLDPRKRFGQGLEALKRLNPAREGWDTHMHRVNAIRAIEGDPDLNRLADFAREVQVHMGTMQQLYKAGKDGTKFQTLVDDIKRRSEILETALSKISAADVAAVRTRVQELVDAEKHITDPQAKKDINAKIQSMNDLLKMVDPNARPEDPGKDARNGRQQLEELFKTIKSRDFNADTFGNWLAENGPVIAAAVAAAAITVASMGTATPLAVILVTSATMLAATQLTKEGLYLFNHHVADTGLGKYDERSHLGKWVAKIGPEWMTFASSMGNRDASENIKKLGELWSKTDESFLKEVGGPMALEYAMNVAMGLVTMGAGNVAVQGLKGAAPRELFKTLTSKPATQLSQAAMELQAMAKDNPALRSALFSWTGRVTKEGMNGIGFVGAQEGIHGGLEQLNKAIGRQNHVASFLIAASLAFVHSKYSAGANPLRIKANEVHVDPKFMEPLIKACQEKGHTVTKMADGTYELRTTNSTAGDPPLILRPQPTVEMRSPHELPEAQRKPGSKPGELPAADAAWLQAGSKQMREGKYKEAYDTASNNPALKDVAIERVELKLDANNLPAGLLDHVQSIKRAGEVVVTPEGKISVKEATTVVKLKSGAEVDVLKPNMEKLTAAQKAEYEALMKTPEMQRVMAEHAMTKFEEAFHIRQFQNDGKIISGSYKDYVAHTGETTGDAASRFNRSQRSFEQELVCALYDAGFPLEAIRRNYGKEYGGRQPVLEYLSQREAGTLGKPGSIPIHAEVAATQGRGEPVRLRRDPEADNAKYIADEKAAGRITDEQVAKLQKMDPNDARIIMDGLRTGAIKGQAREKLLNSTVEQMGDFLNISPALRKDVVLPALEKGTIDIADVQRIGQLDKNSRAAAVDVLQRTMEHLEAGAFKNFLKNSPADIATASKILTEMQSRTGFHVSGETAAKLLQLDAATLGTIQSATLARLISPETLQYFLSQPAAQRKVMTKLIADELAVNFRSRTDIRAKLEELVALDAYRTQGLISDQRAITIAQGKHGTDLFARDILEHQSRLAADKRLTAETLDRLLDMGAKGEISPFVMEGYQRALVDGRLNQSSLSNMLAQEKPIRTKLEAEMMQIGRVADVFPDMFPEKGSFELVHPTPGSESHPVVRDTRRFMEALERGDFQTANEIVSSSHHRADALEIYRRPVEIKLEQLHNPAALEAAKAKLVANKNAIYTETSGPMGKDSVGKVQTPEVVISMAGNRVFKLADSNHIWQNGVARRTTPQEKALIESVQKTEAGKALLGKEALIFFEERLIHANQRPDGSGNISRLREDFMQSPEFQKMKDSPTLALDMREIEVAMALREAGMSTAAVEKLLGNLHPERAPFYEWLRRTGR